MLSVCMLPLLVVPLVMDDRPYVLGTELPQMQSVLSSAFTTNVASVSKGLVKFLDNVLLALSSAPTLLNASS